MFAHTVSLKAHASIALVALCVGMSGCATTPDTKALIARHDGQRANFENALGPVSARANASIMARLKNQSGDSDILERQIALEEAVSDSPLLLGNKVLLLQDGPATYKAMFDAIRTAKDHINVEFYIIEDDAVGQQFADLLLERQANGVQVNLIYDSVGCILTEDAYFERLQAGGVNVLEFNPINPLLSKKEWELNSRDHRKILVVDGRVAFIGGINISDTYSAGSNSSGSSSFPLSGASKNRSADQDEDPMALGPWRDTDVQLEGPVVAELQKLFMDTWQKQNGKPVAPKEYFPTLAPVGNEIIRSIGSTPDDPFSQMYLTLISAIGNAENKIWLTNAYFVPDDQFLQAILDAAKRGVDVRIILPSHTDSSLTFHAGRAHYDDLLEAGVKIYEMEEAVLHSKTAVIDGVWSTVGSTNLDWRSFVDNDEVNAVILGREFGQQMEATYMQDIEHSNAIDLATWKQRPASTKLKETFSSMLERLL
ncbi:MAG: phospholipase D-like domain-containing protein [Pseudomonadota bacterium]